MQQSTLKLQVLGPPQIHYHGASVIDQIPAKALALLVYLVVTRQPAARSTLAGLLWGDQPEETARTNLRLTLSRLRKVVGDCLLVTGFTIAFDFTLPHTIDLLAFEAQAHQPQQADPAQLAAALALYQGEFLAGFSVRDAPDFENWLLVERERLQRLAITCLTHLAEHSQQTNDLIASITWSRRILTVEPWQEEAHYRLIDLLARAGQRSAALAQFESCRRLLAEELDAQPAAATVALVERIRRGEVADKGTRGQGDKEIGRQGNGEISQTNSSPSPPLLVPLSVVGPLIGRERELAQIEERLADPQCRLLTLLGPGGSGKTRLALAVVERTASVENALVVLLAGVAPSKVEETADLLVIAIATQLGMTFAPQRPAREQLLERLSGQKRLLVLDNFEHLRAGSDLLTELVARASGVQLLVTSRERLGLQAEWVVDVAGLAYPSDTGVQADYPAAQLFGQTAQRLRPNLDLTAEAPAILCIIRQVQGLPLAILLAANWVHALSCQQIADQLTQDLDLLATTATDLDERHRSLRAVWDYSWRLLNATEQQSLRRLALFRGDFAVEAATNIGVQPSHLASLVDKSLVQRLPEDRYLVHELLRQYAAEALAQQPAEEIAVQEACCRYYAGFVAERRAVLENRPDPHVLSELDRELAHLRAVRDWLLARQAYETLAQLMAGLWHYYQYRGWFSEALTMLEQVSSQAHATRLQQGRWQRWLGEACYQLGKFDQGRQHLRQALALLDAPMPTTRLGYTVAIGQQAIRQGCHRLFPSYFWGRRSAEAERLLEAAYVWWQQMAMAFFQGDGLPLMVGMLAVLNLEEAVGATHLVARSYATFVFGADTFGWQRLADRYYQLAAAALPQAQQPLTKAYVHVSLAIHDYSRGDWSKAHAGITNAIDILLPLEQQRSLVDAYCALGWVYYYQGDFSQCASCNDRVGGIGKAIDDRLPQLWNLFTQSLLRLRLGDESQVAQTRQELEGVYDLPTPKLTPEQVIWRGLLALGYLRQGDLTQALHNVQTALQEFGQLQVRAFYLQETCGDVAEILLTLWKISQTPPNPLPLSPTALKALATQACRALQRFARIWQIAQPRARLLMGILAWHNGQQTHALACWQQSLALANTLQMPYDQARAYEVLGCHLLGAPSERQQHLQQAQAIFTQIGAQIDLARVEQVLAQ